MPLLGVFESFKGTKNQSVQSSNWTHLTEGLLHSSACLVRIMQKLFGKSEVICTKHRVGTYCLCKIVKGGEIVH